MSTYKTGAQDTPGEHWRARESGWNAAWNAKSPEDKEAWLKRWDEELEEIVENFLGGKKKVGPRGQKKEIDTNFNQACKAVS